MAFYSCDSKFLFFSLLSLTILFAIVNGAYIGTRYGKREFEGETLGRLVPRSESGGGVRNNIQVRSGARFYPGTRYAGKRAYWQPSANLQPDFDEHSAMPNLAGNPFECFYIPQIGVRCARSEESSYWAKNGNDISQVQLGSSSNVDEDLVGDSNVNSLSLSPSSSTS